MMRKKNQARMFHNGVEFLIWQDDKDNWTFSFGTLVDVNTQHKELQPALNEIYDSIESSRRPTAKIYTTMKVAAKKLVVKKPKKTKVGSGK